MKGVAVSQIVFIVIAIIVLAIASYILYSAWKRGGGSIDVEKCRSMAVAKCNECKLSGTLASCEIPAWGESCKTKDGACNWDTSISPCKSPPNTINCVNLGF